MSRQKTYLIAETELYEPSIQLVVKTINVLPFSVQSNNQCMHHNKCCTTNYPTNGDCCVVEDLN